MTNIIELSEKIDWSFFESLHIASDSSENNNVLLMGGTGFLGIHLLKDLLKNNMVYVLVRADNIEHGMKRIEEQATKYKIKLDTTNLKIVLGDISKKNLGINDFEYHALSKLIHKVINLASKISASATLESVMETNVSPQYEVIRFASLNKKKEIHFASTLSVFVSSSVNSGTFYEKELDKNYTEIYGGYAQSKVISEMIYQKAKEYLPVYVYRFGLLTGNTSNYLFPENNFFNEVVNSLKNLKEYPEVYNESTSVDITPVDKASNIMYNIINSDKKDKIIFHIASITSTTLKEFIVELNMEKTKNDIIHDKVNAIDGIKKVLLYYTFFKNEALEKYKKYYNFDLYQSTNCIYDMTNTSIVVDEKNLITKDNDLLKAYLRNVK